MTMDFYELVRGPLATVAFVVLILGVLYQVWNGLLMGKSSKQLYPGDNASGAVRSLFHHSIPFGAAYMRKRPVFTIFTFLFHLSVLVIPLFLLAHVTLWFESFGLMWVSVSDAAADVLTVIALAGSVFFIARRAIVREVRDVSRPSDYLIPVLIFVCYLSGFLAVHQWGPYRPTLILHIVSCEILIMLIPFSRLKHMFFFLFSRIYMGAEYGRVMGSKDW